MTRLFIENNEVDLTSDLSQQITFNIDDIRKIDSKTTSYSRTIVLPGTSRNNKIFGNIFELTHSNDPSGSINVGFDFDASKSANVRVEVNGLLIMKGILRLLSIKRIRSAIEYEVGLFGELGGFMTSIGTKKLEDIDLSDYNHAWTAPNIINTWSPNGQTFTGITINGPFSSINYVPPIDFIRFDVAGQIPWLRPGDSFQVTGSAFNDGVYLVYDILWFPNVPETQIIVQYFVPTPFTPENAPGAQLSKTEWGTGYVYPLIDYGVIDAPGFPNHHDFRTFRPAIFVREYMTRIIEGAGYTFESLFFDTPFFRRLIIPNNDKALEQRGVSQYVLAEDQTFNYTGVSPFFGYVPFSWANPITLNNFNLLPAGAYSNVNFEYIGLSSTTIKIKVHLDIMAAVPWGTGVQFEILRRRSNTDEVLERFDALNRYSGRYTADREVVTGCEPGDFFFVRFRVTLGNIGGQPTGINLQFGPSPSRLTIDQDPPGFIQYAYGQMLEINNAIPKNVYQKDFFLSVVKLFNLMIVEDPLRERHLNITPYVEFYDGNPGTYIDWSDKVARDRPWALKPMSEANARLYEFKYKDDSDYHNDFYKKKWNETYGNKTFDNLLEFSKDKAAVEVIFSSSVLTSYDGEIKVFPSIYKYDENQQLKNPIGHNIRIMQIKYFGDDMGVPIPGWKIYNGNVAVANPDSYLYAGHLDDPYNPLIDINFGVVRELFLVPPPTTGNLSNNLFYLFYSPYMAEIISKDSRLFTCETYLTEADIRRLDFSKLIWIDGGLFRLIKVADWSPGQLNKTELLRVINTTYPLSVPIGAKGFRMKWTNVSAATNWIGGDASDVDNWNNFFQINANPSQFSSVFIEGNVITLLGSLQFDIKKNAFTSCQDLLGIWDDIGATLTIDQSAFSDCQFLKEARFSELYKFNDVECFRACIGLLKFEAPTCEGISEKGFEGCVKLNYLDLRGLAASPGVGGWCGPDLGDNSVFNGIVNNVLTFHLSQAAYVQNDADIDGLIWNNTTNLLLY